MIISLEGPKHVGDELQIVRNCSLNTECSFFILAPCINSIKDTFYCSNWCTLL